MIAWKRICLVCTVLVLGCEVEETVNPAPIIPKCQLPVVGDPNAEPEIEIVALAPGGVFVPVMEGGSVSLLFPPAYGRVLFVSARVRNMQPCSIRLKGELKDPLSGYTRLDSRIMNMKVLDDGWAGSVAGDLFTVSNISVCPNQWADQDLFDNEFELTVTVKDRDGREAMKTINVIPRCDEPGYEAACKCHCSKDYVLGQVCSNVGDAGP